MKILRMPARVYRLLPFSGVLYSTRPHVVLIVIILEVELVLYSQVGRFNRHQKRRTANYFLRTEQELPVKQALRL